MVEEGRRLAGRRDFLRNSLGLKLRDGRHIRLITENIAHDQRSSTVSMSAVEQMPH